VAGPSGKLKASDLEISGQNPKSLDQIMSRAKSVTENQNRYRDILKTETDTDVGIEKTEKNRKPTKKIPKKTNIPFLLMTIY